MIISRTPLRISFLGGGSDLPAFYRQEPGAVLSTAINKYIYITVNPKFDHMIRASYSVTEIVNTPEELRHELIRSTLLMLGIKGGIEITSISDVPSQGTGLGSSSTYTVGLLNALHASLGQYAGAERLAKEACETELEMCGKPIGKQDQYIAAFGGLQHIRFNPDESVFIDPVIVDPAARQVLESHMLLMFTGLAHPGTSILDEQRNNTERDPARRRSLRRMVQLVEDAVLALRKGETGSFGDLLHAGWMEKKTLADGISNPDIDDWYERARRNGATGGKVLGTGGGGFLLLYAPPEAHARIIDALPQLRMVPFNFESQGSKIIYIEESGGSH